MRVARRFVRHCSRGAASPPGWLCCSPVRGVVWRRVRGARAQPAHGGGLLWRAVGGRRGGGHGGGRGAGKRRAPLDARRDGAALAQLRHQVCALGAARPTSRRGRAGRKERSKGGREDAREEGKKQGRKGRSQGRSAPSLGREHQDAVCGSVDTARAALVAESWLTSRPDSVGSCGCPHGCARLPCAALPLGRRLCRCAASSWACCGSTRWPPRCARQ